jgi:bifunctional DNA primase/polymerase-like protein
MMTIPSFPRIVQGLGANREVLRGMSPPERTATAPHGLPCTSSPLIAATALAYLAAGRSVVPIAPGCKAPSVVDPRTGRSRLIRWERYQHVHATPAEVQRWFTGPQPMGIGIVAGPVGSGGARVLVRAAGSRRSPPLSEPTLGPEDWRLAVSRLACPQWHRVVYAAGCPDLPGVWPSRAAAGAIRGDVATPAARRGGYPRALSRASPSAPVRGVPRHPQGL